MNSLYLTSRREEYKKEKKTKEKGTILVTDLAPSDGVVVEGELVH